MFFNEKMETLNRKELEEIQLKRLKKTLNHVYRNNEIFRRKFKDAGVSPDDIRSLDDLKRVPFLTKQELRDAYPLKLACVPKEKIVRIHMSSGTTGKQVVQPYTANDVEQWSEIMARCYAAAGVTSKDVVQITPSFGLFNGGFGFHFGAQKIGAFIVPSGAGNTKRQIQLMKDFGTTCLGAVASYALRILEVGEEMGYSFDTLRVAMLGAESFSESMRKRIEDGMGIEVFDIYGMTETGGVGLGIECEEKNGIHIWEDHYIVEVVDPETGEPLQEGEEGEVVVTAITREALPAIRFKTGDIARIEGYDCACGRTHVRLSRIRGRTDDLIIVKGVKFYPSDVEDILMKIPGVGNNYQIIVKNEEGKRDLIIRVEGNVSRDLIVNKLKEELLITPKVEVVDYIPRSEGKAVRVIRE